MPGKLKEPNKFPGDEQLFLMTCLIREHTGLPFIIWISAGMGNPFPAIKVQADNSPEIRRDRLFTVTITDEPEAIGNTGSLSDKEIELVKKFVKTNQKPLLDYWNEDDIDLVNVVSSLKKIES